MGGSLSSVHLYAEHNMGIVKTDLFIVKKKVKIICIIAILALWVSKKILKEHPKSSKSEIEFFFAFSESTSHQKNGIMCRIADAEAQI